MALISGPGGMCLKIILQGVCEGGKVLAARGHPHMGPQGLLGKRSPLGLGLSQWPSLAGSMTYRSPFAACQGTRQSPRSAPLAWGGDWPRVNCHRDLLTL